MRQNQKEEATRGDGKSIRMIEITLQCAGNSMGQSSWASDSMIRTEIRKVEEYLVGSNEEPAERGGKRRKGDREKRKSHRMQGKVQECEKRKQRRKDLSIKKRGRASVRGGQVRSWIE